MLYWLKNFVGQGDSFVVTKLRPTEYDSILQIEESGLQGHGWDRIESLLGLMQAQILLLGMTFEPKQNVVTASKWQHPIPIDLARKTVLRHHSGGGARGNCVLPQEYDNIRTNRI